MDEIEIIENVPKIEKKSDKKLLMLVGVVGLIAIIIIIIALFIVLNDNKSEGQVKSESSTDSLKEAFKANYEATAKSYFSYLEAAYLEKKALSVINVMDDSVNPTPDIYNVTINHKDYDYLCMTLEDLKTGGYLTEAIKEDEVGYIQIWVSKDNEKIMYGNLFSGKYYFQGDINSSASESAKDGLDVPTSSITCPTSAKFHS